MFVFLLLFLFSEICRRIVSKHYHGGLDSAKCQVLSILCSVIVSFFLKIVVHLRLQKVVWLWSLPVCALQIEARHQSYSVRYWEVIWWHSGGCFFLMVSSATFFTNECRAFSSFSFLFSSSWTFFFHRSETKAQQELRRQLTGLLARNNILKMVVCWVELSASNHQDCSVSILLVAKATQPDRWCTCWCCVHGKGRSM